MLKSLYSGITGMRVNQTKLDVIGNNLANVSTTAFKGSRVTFSTTISQTLTSASAATDSLGGKNGQQIGLGAQIASIDKVMSQGSMQSTSRALDVAIDGSGYFMVASGPALTTGDGFMVDADSKQTVPDNTSVSYTRDGSFVLDNEGNLLTTSGYRVLGYAIRNGANTNMDANGNIEYVESKNDTEAADEELVTLKIPDAVLKDDGNGNKVKVAIRFRGRQLAHVDLGKKVIDDFVEECAEVGQIEKPAKLEGRTLTAILAPKKKK